MRRLARKAPPDVCLVEGFRAVSAAVAAGVEIRELYVAAGRDGRLSDQVEAGGALVVEVEPRALSTCAPLTRSDGVLATVARPATALSAEALRPDALMVVAVGIERPGNLGTIIRTACAAGVDYVVVADPCTDVYHPDVIRGSVGTVFHAHPAVARTREALAWLRDQRVRVVATTPDGDVGYADADYRGRVAIVVGSERHGLPEVWLREADRRVAIPMLGAADSLNVAVAAGVVLFQAAVDRRHARSSFSREQPRRTT